MKGRPDRIAQIYEVIRRHRRGQSNRAIGRALGIDRRTVAKMLDEVRERREAGDDALERMLAKPLRAARASILDPHKAYIDARLEKHPQIRVTTLMKELSARDYTGSYTILREYVKAARPKPTRKPAQLVDHPPGRQAQVDWSEDELADGRDLNGWGTVLSFSKLTYAAFTADRTQPSVFRQLTQSFELFEGVPEEVVFDSMPGVVDRWEMGAPIINLRMLDFAAYYGFAMHIAPRASGQYKGIVERLFRSQDDQLFDGRGAFRSHEEANAACAQWLDGFNRRKHGTTKRRPIDLWAQERDLLLPLPARPYDTRSLAYRLVDGYGRVHYEANRYSVAPSYVGHWVYVRADEATVELFDGQANRLAEHERARPGADIDVFSPAHQPPRKRVSYDLLFGRFADWGEAALVFAQELRRRKRYGRAQLVAILDLQRSFAADDIVAAIEHATRYRVYDAQALTRILEMRAEPRTLADQFADRVRRHIREAMADSPVHQRPVEDIARVIGAAGRSHPSEEANDDDEPTG